MIFIFEILIIKVHKLF